MKQKKKPKHYDPNNPDWVYDNLIFGFQCFVIAGAGYGLYKLYEYLFT